MHFCPRSNKVLRIKHADIVTKLEMSSKYDKRKVFLHFLDSGNFYKEARFMAFLSIRPKYGSAFQFHSESFPVLCTFIFRSACTCAWKMAFIIGMNLNKAYSIDVGYIRRLREKKTYFGCCWLPKFRYLSYSIILTYIHQNSRSKQWVLIFHSCIMNEHF